MSELVRWGILSTARINRLVVDDARKADGAALVAVASRDAGRAERYRQEYGLERAHGSYAALLADTEVDAVYISAPNHLHHEWTLRALAAGKHVLCEKPYSRRPAEVEEAFAAAERAGLQLSEGYMWRHNLQTRLLLDLLPRIGRLETVRATFCVTNTDLENFRLKPELGGGSLMDLGCYCLSAARLLGGEPLR